ncbi:MAG: hypothetical protein Q9168_005349 [Polycauliona sp. 1 TL-2023]
MFRNCFVVEDIEETRDMCTSKPDSVPRSLVIRHQLAERTTRPSETMKKKYKLSPNRTQDMSTDFNYPSPPDATGDKLRELFGMYGRIAHIEIVRRPLPGRDR